MTGATLSIANHADAWCYQATSGPHTSCQGPVAAGTSSQALTRVDGEQYVHLLGVQRQRLRNAAGHGGGVHHAVVVGRRQNQDLWDLGIHRIGWFDRLTMSGGGGGIILAILESGES